MHVIIYLYSLIRNLFVWEVIVICKIKVYIFVLEPLWRLFIVLVLLVFFLGGGAPNPHLA